VTSTDLTTKLYDGTVIVTERVTTEHQQAKLHLYTVRAEIALRGLSRLPTKKEAK
jgi:hypothetical protein